MKKISSFKHAQAGVTLVELMVGMTIGLVVTGGAMSILFTNQKMMLDKEVADRTQEGLRFAAATITRLVRQADSFSAPTTNSELVINFDRSQRDCLGQSDHSTTNTLKLDNNHQLVCILDNDATKSYVLAKDIGSLQFSYGIQQTGTVAYSPFFNSSSAVNASVQNILSNITSIQTQISLIQQGNTQQPTLTFIATSHQRAGVGSLSSGGTPSSNSVNNSNNSSAGNTGSGGTTAGSGATTGSNSGSNGSTNNTGTTDGNVTKPTLEQILALLYVENKKDGKVVKTWSWSDISGQKTIIVKNTDIEIGLRQNTYNFSGWSLSSTLNSSNQPLQDITSSAPASFAAPNGNNQTFSIYLKYNNETQSKSTITFETTN